MEVLTKMLNPNPEERITLEEIKNSAWYKQPLPSKEDVIVEMTTRKLRMEGEQAMDD